MKIKKRKINPTLRWLALRVIDILDWLEYWVTGLCDSRRREQWMKRVGVAIVGLAFLNCVWVCFKPVKLVTISHRLESEFFQNIVKEHVPFLIEERQKNSVWIRQTFFMKDIRTN